MDIQIEFPGGKRVDAVVDGQRVTTDQPVASGGAGTAAAPFDLFLASVGTCAGIYVLGFLQARGLATDGLAMTEHVEVDPASGLPARIGLSITLPPGVPEKYRSAVLRAAEHCKVKKVLAAPPNIEVSLVPSVGEASVGGEHV
jgi:putative redox protein